MGATVSLFDADGIAISNASVLTDTAGRYEFLGLAPATYELRLIPPTPDAQIASTQLREVRIGAIEVVEGENTVRPLMLQPVTGGMYITEQLGALQSGLVFRVDPEGDLAADPLCDPLLDPDCIPLSDEVTPGLVVDFRANTQILVDGQTLANQGIDAIPGSGGREILIEVAQLSADQLPVPFIDLNGVSRTAAVFYQFFPAGVEFSSAATARPMRLDFPNTNGLPADSPVELFQLVEETGLWESGGVGAVSSDGLMVVMDTDEGLNGTGIFAATPAAPTPITITGQITEGSVPLTRSGIIVSTHSGFSGVTNSSGVYSIENVPPPAGNAPLGVTVVNDATLEPGVVRASTPAVYPVTTLDVDIVAPLRDRVPPLCLLASSSPAQGAVNVNRDAALRLRFDGPMDRASLTTTTVTCTAGGVAVEGDVETQAFDDGMGGLFGDVFFLPDEDLPANAAVVVTVAAGVTDLSGNELAEACSLSFTTGTNTFLFPRVYTTVPSRGSVRDAVTLRGVNLGSVAQLQIAGSDITIDSQSNNELSFLIPSGVGGAEPGLTNFDIDSGTTLVPFTLVPLIESLSVTTGVIGTSVLGVDQNDGTLVTITGHNMRNPAAVGTAPVFLFGDAPAMIDDGAESAGGFTGVVFVPPGASTGGVKVLIDLGAGQSLESNSAFFAVQQLEDAVAPTLLAQDPLDMAVTVPTSQVIRLTFDERVSGSSIVPVGIGAPPDTIAIPGTTRVTASPDGSNGILEFLPEGGLLPAATTIQVLVGPTNVSDLSGNAGPTVNFSFTTAFSEPMAEGEETPLTTLDQGLERALSFAPDSLPVATIDLPDDLIDAGDGDRSDWAGLAACVSDSAGDFLGASSNLAGDLLSLAVAREIGTGDLLFRIEHADGRPTAGTRYQFDLHSSNEKLVFEVRHDARGAAHLTFGAAGNAQRSLREGVAGEDSAQAGSAPGDLGQASSGMGFTEVRLPNARFKGLGWPLELKLSSSSYDPLLGKSVVDHLRSIIIE